MRMTLPRTPEPEWMDDPDEAQAYARADFSTVNTQFVRDLLAAYGRVDELLALDLGCGPADIPMRLQIERPRWWIVAMDASWPMLRIAREDARRHEASRILLIRAAAQRLPVKDGCAALIFSNSLLHHLRDPMPLWHEIARVAAPGGFLFLRDLMRPSSEEAARSLVREHAGSESSLLQEEFYRSLLAAFTPEEVRQQLRLAGLTHFQVRPASDRHLDVRGRVKG